MSERRDEVDAHQIAESPVSIRFECEHCAERYRVADERAGARLRCKGCGEAIRVPDPDAPSRPRRKSSRRPKRSQRRPTFERPKWVPGVAIAVGVAAVLGILLFVVLRNPSATSNEVAGPTGDDRTRFPGTRVELQLPLSHRWRNGVYILRPGGETVVLAVFEVKIDRAAMLDDLRERILGENDEHVVSQREVRIADRPATLYLTTKTLPNGNEYPGWLGVFGNDETTVVIHGDFKTRGSVADREVESLILGAKWDPSQPLNPTEGLPYRIEPPASLSLAARFGPSTHYRVGGDYPGDEDATVFDVMMVPKDFTSVDNLDALVATVLTDARSSYEQVGRNSHHFVYRGRHRENGRPYTVLIWNRTNTSYAAIVMGGVPTKRERNTLIGFAHAIKTFEWVR